MHALSSPLGLGLLLALALAIAWRRLPRSARWAGIALECVLVASICPFVANLLVGQIEGRVPLTPVCTPAPDAIVVLSAGFARAPVAAGDAAALESDSIRRVLAGIELWRRTPDATLVLAGGGPFAISESAVLQDFAEHLGVPRERIRREDRSQSTWENAEQLRALAPPLPQRIWLVSSAVHLPRALIAFRANGFAACAYASDRRYLPPGGIGYFLPQASSLAKTETAIHELLGEAMYRWRAAESPRRASSTSS